MKKLKNLLQVQGTLPKAQTEVEKEFPLWQRSNLLSYKMPNDIILLLNIANDLHTFPRIMLHYTPKRITCQIADF